MATKRHKTDDQAFDYVVVGAGSAGSTLAGRLSDDQSVTVCVLEAGGRADHWLIRAPLGIVALLPGRPRINNWAYRTATQPLLNGRRGYQPRGKGLGGSSAINAMMYVRGHRGDYDTWASLGCPGWSYDDVLPYFRKSENNQRGASQYHGADGPLEIADLATPHPIGRAFVQAAETCGISRNDDFNGGEQFGSGPFQFTQFHSRRQGQRCSAADAFLRPAAKRKNLVVLTNSLATRVNVEAQRAVGVTCLQRGRERTILARREIILCAGAFNTPQLLMLSGIGDPASLRRHGIQVLCALPGVGKNLQDHLDVVLAVKSSDTSLLGLGIATALKAPQAWRQWTSQGAGPIASPCTEAGAFIRTQPDLARPDVQLILVTAIVDEHGRRLHFGHGYSCHVTLLRPYSHGEVFLQDADPRTPPGIDPRYLSDERDLDVLISGAKMARTILRTPPLDSYSRQEIKLDTIKTDAQWADFVRARADTIYHPVGSCRMGTRCDAVVDPQLQVRGVRGLRVADASIMPTIVSGNTNAPTIMIAEKAADMIRKARLEGTNG